MGTFGNGVYAFDQNNNYELIKHFQHESNNTASIRNDTLMTVYADKKGKIWFGTVTGLDVITPGEEGNKEDALKRIHFNTDEPYKMRNNSIYGLKEDKAGTIWIRSHYGIIAYHPETGKNKIWPVESPRITSFDRFFSLKTLAIDNTGSVWNSALDQGISRIKFQNNKFNFFHHKPTNANSLSSNKVTGIYQDTSGILWLGTRNHGLNKRIPAKGNNESETWHHYTHDPLNPKSISSNEIRTLLRDTRGDLWIGTRTGGLNKFIDLGKGNAHFENYLPDFVDREQGNRLDILCEDTEENLWVGGDGLFLFDRDNEQFYKFVSDSVNMDSVPFRPAINALDTDSGGIWVSTWNEGIYKISPPFKRFGNYVIGTTKSYNTTNLRGKLEDWGIRTIRVPKIHKESILWVGTDGRGLLCLRNDGEGEYFDVYSKKEGLPHLVVQGIEEDDNGNIWIATKDGLSRFDPETGLFINYYKSDGLADDFFKLLAHHKSADGKLYFGADGLISFYPDEVIKDGIVPPVYITDIKVSNAPLSIGENSPLKQAILETKEITLSHEQNFISLEFVSLNLNKRKDTRYKYKLEGFDKDWVDAGTELIARYPGLQPGNYRFRVMALNDNGIWNTGGATLKIIIRPPWWKTLAAYIIYILLLLLAIYAIIKAREKKLNRDKKKLEEKILRRTEELHEANAQLKEHHKELEQQKEELEQTLNYLKETQSQLVQSEKMASIGQLTAGIAHEINNPVNYISAGIDSLEVNLNEIRRVLDLYNEITPENADEKLQQINEVKKLLEYQELIPEIEGLIGSIKSGSERTTEIVKGLRTFSRLDENEIKPADIHEGIDLTLVMLHNKFKQHVEIIKEYKELPLIECYPGKLNQVFMNILSNAIEAIIEKGTVTIKTWEDKPVGKAFISIKDDGMGMSASVKSNIFNPFYTTKEVGKGTGLGLSISHGIIEQHGGSIEVKSRPGNGTEFIIALPVKNRKCTP
jgi:signal transduction histidine kinase/ligand-binding sensor domain-containing protein